MLLQVTSDLLFLLKLSTSNTLLHVFYSVNENGTNSDLIAQICAFADEKHLARQLDLWEVYCKEAGKAELPRWELFFIGLCGMHVLPAGPVQTQPLVAGWLAFQPHSVITSPHLQRSSRSML